MFKLQLDRVIDKIKQETGITETEIKEKIKAKVSQLSGLISEEGAAYIIANELGVKLFEQTIGRLQIKNIIAGMRNVETAGRIQRIFPPKEFSTENGKGKVGSVQIADSTGRIRVVFWHSQADIINKLKEGTIIKIKGAYARENKGRLELHMSERSSIEINPQGIEIKEAVPERKAISQLSEGDDNIEILGTIVQVFEPNFFETCPNCGKRVRKEEDAYVCPEHGKIEPRHAYVLNLFLDDGTENIRVVLFKTQTNVLLGKTEQEVLSYRDNPQLFAPIKDELLGSIVKFEGRVSKNIMFDRLEFIARRVYPNPDPEEELARLKNTANE